ncbi:YTH domain-containing protein ECT4-like isoform X3 [Actinidia eriantha]|uniref:YTH domain-containing protein ECT4-like isoform X3 n=1 Tax=Actinidia eriantha TaxID=165200 RepID=UPI002587874F|nr:YTH domain-containing protein ECT4-like isoform X3 [Actinidia eriantha]
MSTVAPPADQAVDLLQKLSLDSQTKILEGPESAQKYAPVDSGTPSSGLNKLLDQSMTPLHQDFMDPMMCYVPNGYPYGPYYCEAGYDGSGNEYDYYSRYGKPDGIETPSGFYGDNSSLMYHLGYNYPSYGTCHPPGSPVPTMGHDGQLYGPQHYQYHTYYQPSAPTSASFNSNQAEAPHVGVSTTTIANQVSLPVEAAKMNQRSVSYVSKPLRPNHQNLSLGSNSSHGRGGLPTGITSSGYEDRRFASSGIHSSNPWLDAPILPDWKSKHAPLSHGNNFPSGRNQNLRPFSHITSLQHPRPTSGISQAAFMDSLYPNKYGQYANTLHTGTRFGLNGYDPRTNGRGWLGVHGKYKPKCCGDDSSGYGNENVDGLNELNRGPRAKGFMNQKDLEPVTLAVKGHNISLYGNSCEDKSLVPDKELYNREDLLDTYSDAKFFIIKSYSEDDVHKSIKYGVWASTPTGNKKLDAAYQEAQSAAGDCPVFLFFSVNASGQFVGLAEMFGTVDFRKSMEYWQQDKWTGCFPVKWHIVKDVPNSLLKHITLENNENKPVTNSRDTQEVKFEQGIEMLRIFKAHSCNTCVLDDFGFYDARQKIMQEKKAKQQPFDKQVGSRKPIDNVMTDNKGKDGSSIAEQGREECIASEKLNVNGDLDNKSAEKRVVQNGVANAC